MIELTDATFKIIINETPLPIVIDFWAEWCGPCKKFTPVLEELAEKYKGQVIFAKARVEENGEAVPKYGIRSLPTLIFLKDGVEFDRSIGVIPSENIDHILKYSWYN